jgi:hypothetical protein
MKAVNCVVAIVVTVLTTTPILAQGASKSAPGQQMQQTPQKEDKGASTFSPGQKMQQTPAKEPRGASTFAPGQTTGQGSKKSK